MKLISRWLLRLSGWTLTDKSLPGINKIICIFAPHTSNWDFVIMIIAKFAFGIKVRFLGKHSLFFWPYGWFFRALGGMPVTRHKNHNVVTQVVALIKDNETILLALAPEGTRSFKPYWKTGFYHIAEKADIPVLMFYLDTKTRSIGFGELFKVTGDIDADMEVFKAFYKHKEGFNPQQTSLIQTKKQYKLSERVDA